MIISLMGFMGSGKSTFGRRLAARLDWEFIDLDDYIVENEGMTINEIFSVRGEKVFRQMEQDYLKRIIHSQIECIVSLGGGTPCNDEIWNHISNTKSIYLKRTPNFLFNILRTKKVKRPLIKDLNDEELKILIDKKLEERSPFYERSDLIFHGYGSKKALENRLVHKANDLLIPI